MVYFLFTVRIGYFSCMSCSQCDVSFKYKFNNVEDVNTAV